ncbi:MAG TPA: tetratricopeptide repeat protein [Bacteroidota bacterium]|nr:tetratricopeptide repeat protein [Bacteroidota bacterium]
MISRTKKIVFTLTTLIIVFVVLAAAELFLRVFIPSLDTPLVNEVRVNGNLSYEVNRQYLGQYFPSASAVIPEFKPTVFAQHKPASTFRIICLGSSSMFGTPYQFTANIPSLVRKQLRHSNPGREIEVINFAAAAINSNVILDIARQLPQFEPDLVLIYMGHNEFYGPEGVGASWLEKHWDGAITIKYALRKVRLITAVERMIASFSSDEHQPIERNLMKQVSHGNLIRLQSEESDRIFTRFDSNLRRIVSIFSDRRIPVILSDLTSNLTFPPFMYDTSSVLRSHGADFTRIRAKIGQQDDAPALDYALTLYRIDSLNAGLNYLIGSIYSARKQPALARPYLERARDEDLLKFRAPGRINDILRTVAREQSLPIISTDSLFFALSSGNIPGNELFREHLHPNARGYYEIATLYVRAILSHQYLNQPSPSRPLLDPFNTDSLAIPWLDLAYGDLAVRQLTTHWPFQGFKAVMDLSANEDPLLMRMAEDVYTSKTSLNDGILQTAARFSALHRYADAQTSYAALIDQYPDNYYPYYLSASLYKEAGDISRAVPQYEAAMRRNPDYIFAPIELGLLEISAGRFGDAIGHLSHALDLARAQHVSPLVSATIYYGLAAAYVNQSDTPRALSNVKEAVRLAPDYEAARSLYNRLQTQR